MSEMVDVYDENKNKIGKIIERDKLDTLNKNEYNITVHCFIINSRREILMTQRSLNKNRGGKWEETHGGVRSGETSAEGLKRELEEEIGINIDVKELKLVKTKIEENTIRDIYVLFKDIPIEEIVFNDKEVMNCKYVTLDELKEMINYGECSFTNFNNTIFYDNDIEDLIRKD